MEEEVQSIKVVAVGDNGVGKKWFLVAFTSGPTGNVRAIMEYSTRNYYVNRWHDITVDDKPFQLSVWDAVTQEDYSRLRFLTYAETDVFLLCFSTESPTSLANVKDRWTPEIRHYCPGTPVVLVGMKKDLRSTSRDRHSLVPESTASQVAKEIGAEGYYETSAITREGVLTVMEGAVRAAMSKRNFRKSPKRKGGFCFPCRRKEERRGEK